PAPDPRQIQSTVEDHVCTSIGVPSFPSQTVATEARTSWMARKSEPCMESVGLTPARHDAPQRSRVGCEQHLRDVLLRDPRRRGVRAGCHRRCAYSASAGRVPPGCGYCFETSPHPSERRQSAGEHHAKPVFKTPSTPLDLYRSTLSPSTLRSSTPTGF